MADFIRRLVSGNKARFKDGELDLELDLAYITDRVIVMGFPATGIEGLYRNRREDAKKFLDHRHSGNYWIFNFCPVRENSYPASVFEGRVSRYPFPDHHVPPLAIVPLITREIRDWLGQSPDHVAVLHCKAGKGRSGMMACAYLLSLELPPLPPRSKMATDIATDRAKELMDKMPSDVDDASLPENEVSRKEPSEEDLVKQEISTELQNTKEPPKTELRRGPKKRSTVDPLKQVLDLHTARRMKTSETGKKIKPGVSIPSQRRWLYYWSLILAHQAPPEFWPLDSEVQPPPKVQLKQIKLRMRELSGVKSNLLKAANALMDYTSLSSTTMATSVTSRSKGQVWVSLARYDDELVETLEAWEKHTRSEDGNLGKRREGSESMSGQKRDDLFKTDKWDRAKMIRSFARLGSVGNNSVQQEITKEGNVVTHLLSPLSNETWNSIRTDIEEDKEPAAAKEDVASENTSMFDVTRTLNANGVVLDANREVRAKLYMGQVLMGWFWITPTFHMQHSHSPGETSTLQLTRKELDFPLGLGKDIIDLEVTMEWCSEIAEIVAPPARQSSQESEAGQGEPAGFLATAEALSGSNLGKVMDLKSGTET